jgi:hypothetical protein
LNLPSCFFSLERNGKQIHLYLSSHITDLSFKRLWHLRAQPYWSFHWNLDQCCVHKTFWKTDPNLAEIWARCSKHLHRTKHALCCLQVCLGAFCTNQILLKETLGIYLVNEDREQQGGFSSNGNPAKASNNSKMFCYSLLFEAWHLESLRKTWSILLCSWSGRTIMLRASANW